MHFMLEADLQKIRQANVGNIVAKLKAGGVLSREDKITLAEYAPEQAGPVPPVNSGEKPPRRKNLRLSDGRGNGIKEEIFTAVIARICLGETLSAIARDVGFSASGFRYQVAVSPTLFARYARARMAQADAWADQIVEIADDARRDTKIIVGHGGKLVEVCDNEWVQRSRLRVDTRKWIMAKLHPKAYGDKLELAGEVKTGQPDAPARITVNVFQNTPAGVKPVFPVAKSVEAIELPGNGTRLPPEMAEAHESNGINGNGQHDSNSGNGAN